MSYRVLLDLLLSACAMLSSLPAWAAVQDLKQPNAYAVVIGISQYREEVIPKVAYAVKDAQAVASLLETQGGIPKTHIRLLTDSKATGNDLRSVGDWLRMRVKPDSTVYVYYAGHGTPNPQTGEAYLVPWDGHPDYPSGLYPLKDLYATLNALPTKDVIVMLDSCFSGAAGRSVLAKDTRPMVISMENPLLASGKVIVLAASTGNQVSSDYARGEHGLFTHYLLAGLNGEADADHDGIVTLKEIFPYVHDSVAQAAVDELNREQTPVLLPGEEMLGKRIAQPLAQVADKPKPQEPKPIQEARARPYEAPRQAGREITGKDGAPMVLVPEGEFLYGSNNQRLTLSAYYIDKFEVMTAQYAKFMAETGTKEPAYWETSVPVGNGQKPVIGVTWDDADAYCRHYGKRLPTEQEWEKAARGTNGRKYPWGNDQPSGRYANYGKDRSDNFYNDRLAPVGNYEAGKSPYGIYDLAGNVWEWTDSDEGSYKVLRGGSWFLNANYLESTFRYRWIPARGHLDLGFRCIQDVR